MRSMSDLPLPPAFLTKLCERDQLPAALAHLPRPWVFTNGVFDVLHRGHVMYLAQARALLPELQDAVAAPLAERLSA